MVRASVWKDLRVIYFPYIDSYSKAVFICKILYFCTQGPNFLPGLYFGHTNAGLILKDFALFPVKLLSIKNLYIL